MSEDRVQQLLESAMSMPPGTPKVEVLDEAVREADACGLEGAAFDARMQLIHEAAFAGHGDRVLVAFPWCLAKADEKPDEYSELDLLWPYKWALESSIRFPNVDRGQIERLLNDFATRLRRHNYSTRPANYLEMQYEFYTGRLERAEAKLQQWREEPRDDFADCAACEQDNLIELRMMQRRDDEAIAEAAQLIDGTLTCAEVPHNTFAKLVVCSMRAGRWDDARSFYRKGYPRVRKNTDFLRQVGQHALYVASQKDLATGIEVLERHLPLAMVSRVPRDCLELYNGCAAVARAFGDAELSLRLPDGHPMRRDGAVAAAELAEWLEQQVAELGSRFDERNGNQWETDLARHHRELAGG